VSATAPARGTLEVGAFFDDRVTGYDHAYDLRGWGGYVLRTRMQAVLEVLGDGPGEVLDAGMGPGRLCEQLAMRGWTVSGVDISEQMVRHARARLSDGKERLRQGTLDQLPFPDASFDAVTATGVLEYAASVPVAVRELARVLRPGGLAVLSIPNRGSMHGLSRRLTDPVGRTLRLAVAGAGAQPGRRDRVPSASGFERMVADAGLRIGAVRYVGALVIPAPADKLMPATVERLGAAFERRGRLRKVAATQIVVTATNGGGGSDGSEAAGASVRY
jgi:ubiquinone/menaquinone biosynthesis C-methylase UbiE